jgi:glycerate kinase
VAALVEATHGKIVNLRVTGPLGDPVDSLYGLSGDGTTAIIEMAAASGLDLVSPDKRNPLMTTSYGTGELIRHALDKGVRNFIIGIGGSATNDGGAGMLQALGVKLLDADNLPIGHGGGCLEQLVKIDPSELDRRIGESRIQVACDVNNPLTGERGASAVFGPQKGATPEMVRTLDGGLGHFAELIRRRLGIDVEQRAGAGAAGGMGAALLAFLDADLRPGVGIVVEAIKLDEAVRGACLVITGEGRMDSQTVHGKAPIGVAKVASAWNVPVIGIAGSLGEGVEAVYDHGLAAVFSVVPGPCSLEQALADARHNLRITARNIAALLPFKLT